MNRPPTLEELRAMWVQHEAAKLRHERRLRDLDARVTVHAPAPLTLPADLDCTAACGHPVRHDDWAVHDPATDRAWHAWCWHTTEAPGQGDLLDLLPTP